MKTEFDYEGLGFRCGLECHQQLAGRKLFCSCPSSIRKDKPDFTITRKLRAAAGESGEVDEAARQEMNKSKDFVYQGYDGTTCEVECDESPPLSPNSEAIETALVMAKLLNMKVVDSIQFMRKTVVDGSNVSGFQRTALIGYDGYIDLNGKKIGIATLCLEEEAAQVMSRTEKKDTYNLSRLGIPLLEIATDSGISTPQECMDAAAHIGMLLRSTNKVLRGIGTIRQDVNISIKGGARTEIKGFQEYKSIPDVIDKEIKRQLELVKKGKPVESGVRKAEPDMSTTFLRPMPGADRMYPETDIETIVPARISLEIPETIEQKQGRYISKFGLSKDLAMLALKYEQKERPGYRFEDDFKKYKVSPTIITDMVLIKAPDAMKKEDKSFDVQEFKNDLLKALEAGKIAASSLPEILRDVAKTGKLDLGKYSLLGEKEVESIISSIIAQNKGAPKGAVMGKVMAELKGRADGKKVADIMNRILS